MASQLLAKKPLSTIMAEASATGEHSLKRSLGPGKPHYPRHWRNHRHRHLHPHRCRPLPQFGRPGHCSFLHRCRHRLRVRRICATRSLPRYCPSPAAHTRTATPRWAKSSPGSSAGLSFSNTPSAPPPSPSVGAGTSAASCKTSASPFRQICLMPPARSSRSIRADGSRLCPFPTPLFP